MPKLNHIKIVATKEITDNLRDRKSVLSSLLIGSVFMPILFVVMLNVVFAMQKEKMENPLEFAIKGIDNAENLIQFIQSEGAIITAFEGDPSQAILDKKQQVILVVPNDFADNFNVGNSARVSVYYNSSTKGLDNITYHRVLGLIDKYSQTIGILRLQLRGIDPTILKPITIEQFDVATSEAKAARVLAFLPYVLLIGLFLGSMYLAIDTTAGEKERQSLEPLLLNPVKRSDLLIGKLLATTSFSLLSIIITIVFFKLTIPFMPLAAMGFSIDLNIVKMLILLLILTPLSVFAAALQTIIATYSKSFKEAQTYVNLVIIVPMIPSLILMLMPVKEQLWMFAVPILSQNLLIDQLLRGDSTNLISMVLSIFTTLIVAIGLAYIAILLFSRESILFNKSSI